MLAWIALVAASILVGIVCGKLMNIKTGLLLSAVIPWLGLLGVLLFQEYVFPYKGGGASMWPIAMLFGGTVAALTGMVSFWVTKAVFGEGI